VVISKPKITILLYIHNPTARMISFIFRSPFRLTAREDISNKQELRSQKIHILKNLLFNQVEVASYIMDITEYMEIYDSSMKKLLLKSCLIITVKDIYTLPTKSFMAHYKTEEFLILLNKVKGLVHKQLQFSEFYDLIIELITKYLEKEPWCDQTKLLQLLIKEFDYNTLFTHFQQ
jgi:hypothetical protein